MNVVSQRMMDIFKLLTEEHPQPYTIAWVKDHSIPVKVRGFGFGFTFDPLSGFRSVTILVISARVSIVSILDLKKIKIKNRK